MTLALVLLFHLSVTSISPPHQEEAVQCPAIRSADGKSLVILSVAEPVHVSGGGSTPSGVIRGPPPRFSRYGAPRTPTRTPAEPVVLSTSVGGGPEHQGWNACAR